MSPTVLGLEHLAPSLGERGLREFTLLKGICHEEGFESEGISLLSGRPLCFMSTPEDISSLLPATMPALMLCLLPW